MLTKLTKTISIAFLFSSCAPAVDEELISYFGAPEESLVQARKAADLCLATVGAWDVREARFREAGYLDAMFEDPDRNIEDVRATILIEPISDVVVQLGKRGGPQGCIVGVKGMSPAQSYELAQPWVLHFNAKSNEELGQGLTPNAIQAWRARSRYGQIFIAAYKTWDILEEPGAAIRLSN